MSQRSFPKTTSNKLLFTKNIRLNLNPKLIPKDFFPLSISQYCKGRKTIEKQDQPKSTKKSLSQNYPNQEKLYLEKEAKHLQLNKRRLTKTKQAKDSSTDNHSKEKMSFKRFSKSSKRQRTISINQHVQKNQNTQKYRPKRSSIKMIEYMQKMKDVINIDIKFKQDFVSPTYYKNMKGDAKQNYDDIETDDSPKLQRYRPRSQINNKQKQSSKQKLDTQLNNITPKPLRINAKDVRLMKKQELQQKIRKNDRYNKFADIQLNEEGMLTFYGSFNKNVDSYDSRKYSIRSSLPKLQE